MTYINHSSFFSEALKFSKNSKPVNKTTGFAEVTKERKKKYLQGLGLW
jgi:hypothetical protein